MHEQIVRSKNLFYKIISLVFLIYFVAASGIFFLFTPLFALLGLIFDRKGLDGALLRVIYLYGRFTQAIFWPYIRSELTGRENLPKKGPAVYVVNHRSAADAYFSAAYAQWQTIMFVRSWPFKIPVYGTFMRLSGYVDVESTSIFEFARNQGKKLAQRNASFLFFPEGHRSPDGKMRRFRSGAFFLACELNIPVVPVCISGTENFLSKINPVFKPAKVHIHILPPVWPETFVDQNQIVDMKKNIQRQMKAFLGEASE